MRRAFFEAAVARTHTLLFLARWVACPLRVIRSPVAFLVAVDKRGWSMNTCCEMQ